jgi:hypothetical protein
MLTLKQVKNSTVANVASCNPNDQQFIDFVNDAVRMLLDLGGDSGWWGTVVAMDGLVSGGRLTWPFKIDSVLAFNVNDRPVDVANFWYSFVPNYGCFAGRMRDPDFLGECWGGGCGRDVLEFSGTQAMFSGPSLVNPFSIQVTADNPADYGKTVTIYGLDTNGQDVYSNQFDGTANAAVSQRGVKLTLAAVAPVTPNVFQTVTEVAKDLTTGCVRAWAYANSTPGRLCAIWGGSQTSPEYLYSNLDAVPRHHIARVSALVKLGFEAVAQDSDILVLGNVDAIKSMVQAIKLREAGDDEGADKFEKTAIRRLNAEIGSRIPLGQIQLQNNTFGAGVPQRRRLY